METCNQTINKKVEVLRNTTQECRSDLYQVRDEVSDIKSMLKLLTEKMDKITPPVDPTRAGNGLILPNTPPQVSVPIMGSVPIWVPMIGNGSIHQGVNISVPEFGPIPSGRTQTSSYVSGGNSPMDVVGNFSPTMFPQHQGTCYMLHNSGHHQLGGMHPQNLGNQHYSMIPPTVTMPGVTFTPTPSHSGRNYVFPTRVTKLDFPKFEGDEVKPWLYRCESFFKLDQTPDASKVLVASVALEGRALQWYQTFEQDMNKFNLPLDWTKFSTAILHRFGKVYENEDEIAQEALAMSEIQEWKDEYRFKYSSRDTKIITSSSGSPIKVTLTNQETFMQSTVDDNPIAAEIPDKGNENVDDGLKEDEISLAFTRENQEMTHADTIDGAIFEGGKIGTSAAELNAYSADGRSLGIFGQVTYQPFQDDNGDDGSLEKNEDVIEVSLTNKDKEAIDVNEALLDFSCGTWSLASSATLSFGPAMAFSNPAFSFVSCHHSENDEVSDFSFFSNLEIIDKTMDKGVINQHEDVPCVITGRKCFYPLALCQTTLHDPFIGGSIVAQTSKLVSFRNMKEANGHFDNIDHIFGKSEGGLGHSFCAFEKFGDKDPSPAWIKFSFRASGAIPYKGIYGDPTKEEWYLFEHFQAKDHVMPPKHVINHHKLESGYRNKLTVDLLRNSSQSQKPSEPQIKELDIFLVNALQLPEFWAKWFSGQMVEDFLVFEYKDLTSEDILAHLKLGNFHLYEIHGSDHPMNRATYLQKFYNQHTTGSRIQHFRGHLKIESNWVQVSVHIIMPTSENENKTSMKASRKEDLIANHPIPQHTLEMQLPYWYLRRIVNWDHLSCLNSRQHIWLLPLSNLFGSSSYEEVSKALFNTASNPIEFKEQKLGQKEVKILKKLMILIWGWYYKDCGEHYKEGMKTLKLMLICSVLNQHPGQWMLQWLIAWVKKFILSIM